MIITQKSLDFLTNELKSHEGCKKNNLGEHIAYKCSAGFTTIGYGHNLDANPLPSLHAGSTITEKEALEILQQDIETIITLLDKELPFVKLLDEARYTALVNMCFNLGIGTLKTFKNSLSLLEQAKYSECAKNLEQSKWYSQVGNRAKTLVKRIETGEYENKR